MSRIPDNKSLPVYANNGFSPLESAVLQTIMRNPDLSQLSEDDDNVCMCADAPAANSFLQPHIGGPFRIAMYSISENDQVFSPPFVLQLQPCCHDLLEIHDQSHKHTVRVFHSWILNPFTCSFYAASVCFFVNAAATSQCGGTYILYYMAKVFPLHNGGVNFFINFTSLTPFERKSPLY